MQEQDAVAASRTAWGRRCSIHLCMTSLGECAVMAGGVSGHVAHAETLKIPFLKSLGLIPEPHMVFRWELSFFHLHLSMGKGSPGQLTPGFCSA